MSLATQRPLSAATHSWSPRVAGLVVGTTALLVASVASLAVGSNAIPTSTVWRELTHPDGSYAATIVLRQRLPRTVLVIVVGAALGVAGALMQSLTRNPLADPGILGVNAGASLAVVLGVSVAGVRGVGGYVWFAFAGAAMASVAVYALGSVGRSRPTPARLALAGVAMSMTISSVVQAVILTNQNAFNEFRYWAAGSVEARGYPVVTAVVGFVAVGLAIALALAPSLNALALGEEAGRALGVPVGLVRAGSVAAITLLAGAATAAAGPIMFIGLGVPYLARAVCGSDQRWVLPMTMVTAPVALLAADMLARVLVAPQELPVGIVAALLGGPVFVAIVRRRRIESL